MTDSADRSNIPSIYSTPIYEDHFFVAHIPFPWEDHTDAMRNFMMQPYPLIGFLRTSEQKADYLILNYAESADPPKPMGDYLQEQHQFLSRTVPGFSQDEATVQNIEGRDIGYITYASTAPKHDMHSILFATSFDNQRMIHGIYSCEASNWDEMKPKFLHSIETCQVLALPQATAGLDTYGNKSINADQQQ